MCVEELIALLKKETSISAFEITKTTKQSSELFFVKKGMELNRATNTEDIVIDVYVDQDEQRGSSKVIVTSADDADTIGAKLASAVQRAKLAMNPYFPLAEKQDCVDTEVQIPESLNEIAIKVADAIMAVDCYKDGQLNATEIFVSKITKEFYNSSSVAQREEKFSIEFETIPTWSNHAEEFELYKYYRNNKFDAESIKEEVTQILQLSKERSEAKKTSDVGLPKDLPVLVYGEMASLIVRNVVDNASYMSKVTQSNHYEVGDRISKNPFSVTLKGSIPGCINSADFDEHGVALTSLALIKDGKLIDTFGDIQFGHYAGVKNPSGNYKVCEITGETSDFVSKPHIIIDHFSAPQLESASGYFGGEVRMARYFDGEKYIPLSSFTVTGNIYEDIKDIRFSKENTTTVNYTGPKYFIFDHMHII